MPEGSQRDNLPRRQTGSPCLSVVLHSCRSQRGSSRAGRPARGTCRARPLRLVPRGQALWRTEAPHHARALSPSRMKQMRDSRDTLVPSGTPLSHEEVGEGTITVLALLRSALRYVCLCPRGGAPADYSGRRSCCVVPFSCGASLRRFSSALQGLPPPVPALGSLLPLLLPPDSALRPLLPPVGEGTGMRARRANQTPKSEKA